MCVGWPAVNWDPIKQCSLSHLIESDTTVAVRAQHAEVGEIMNQDGMGCKEPSDMKLPSTAKMVTRSGIRN